MKDADTPEARGHIPRQARGRQKYDAILATAKELMAEHGVGGLRLSDIAKKADISLGAIYRYFPNKEDIVRLIAEQYFEQVGAAVFAHVTEPPEDLDAFAVMLRKIYGAYMEMLVSDPGALSIFICVASDPALTARSRDVSREHAQAMADLTAHLFPAVARDDLVRQFYLSMIMAQPLVEAALVLDGDARQRTMDTGFELLLAPYSR